MTNKRSQSSDPSSHVVDGEEVIYVDATEPAEVILGEAGLRAVECLTLQEAILCVCRLDGDEQAFALIRTKSGKTYRRHEFDRLYKAVPEADKIAADTARYEALAREHGADLSEEGFNEALRKVGRKNG